MNRNATCHDVGFLRAFTERCPVVAHVAFVYATSWGWRAPAAMGLRGPKAMVLIYVGVWGPSLLGAASRCLRPGPGDREPPGRR